MKKQFYITLLLGLSLTCASCAEDVSPDTYSSSSINQPQRVERGKIIQIRNVKIDNNSQAGGTAGALAGGAAGSMIGGSSAVNVASAVGGAVIGGLAGNALDKKLNSSQGLQLIIELNSGNTVSITQAKTKENGYHVGEQVLILYGRTTRVVPDDTAQSSEPTRYRRRR